MAAKISETAIDKSCVGLTARIAHLLLLLLTCKALYCINAVKVGCVARPRVFLLRSSLKTNLPRSLLSTRLGQRSQWLRCLHYMFFLRFLTDVAFFNTQNVSQILLTGTNLAHESAVTNFIALLNGEEQAVSLLRRCMHWLSCNSKLCGSSRVPVGDKSPSTAVVTC